MVQLRRLEALEIAQARAIMVEWFEATDAAHAWIRTHATDEQRAAWQAVGTTTEPERELTTEQIDAINSIELPADLRQRWDAADESWGRVIGDGLRAHALLRKASKGLTVPEWITSP